MSADPEYTVVVPAFNEEALLPRTLAALARAMAEVAPAGEVVVCDNNSSDATAEVAQAAGARVVFEPFNQISRARNAGARAARGRFLVFVDADTDVAPGLLAAALEALASGRAVGGGSTIAVDAGWHWLMRCAVAGWNRLSRRLRLAAGSFVFARRDAFEAVGGFSEKVYASEEIWLSRRLRRWGEGRGLEFLILDRHPVTTSGRKAEWYPAPALLGLMIGVTLFPFLVRSRRFCWMWYRRPGGR